MIKIGITGGIGSGKGVVSRLFETLGIPVYNTDAAAKKMMDTDPVIKKKLMARFGEECYEQGVLNRNYLSTIIFNNRESLSCVNAIVHPCVIADFNRWALATNRPVVGCESAILFEAGMAPLFDHIIVVTCPVEERISRVMARDCTSRASVMARIANQKEPDLSLFSNCYRVINDNQHPVIPQISDLLKSIHIPLAI